MIISTARHFVMRVRVSFSSVVVELANYDPGHSGIFAYVQTFTRCTLQRTFFQTDFYVKLSQRNVFALSGRATVTSGGARSNFVIRD